MAFRNNLERVRLAEDIEIPDFDTLVRCKKCTYAKKSDAEGHFFCGKFGTTLPDDFFCGYGVPEYIRAKEKEKFDDR